MPPVINQSEILTLPILYYTNRIPINTKPSIAPSSTINAKIGLIRTDITTLHLPNGAIVNAANERLSAGGGVCGAIHRAAGRELGDECQKLGRCETGYAKITRAYRLPCKKVIHAVGPIYWQAKETNEQATQLASCYTETLKLAVEHGLNAVAFSALSTGIYGYPSYEAAETALAAVRKFLETEQGKKLDLVVFCNFEKKDEVAYTDLISHYFPPPETRPKVEETTESDKPTKAAGPKGAVDSKEVDSKEAADSKEAVDSKEVADPKEATDSKDTADSKEAVNSNEATDPTDANPTGPEPALSDKPEEVPNEVVVSPAGEPKPAKSESVPVDFTESDAIDDFVLIDKDYGPESKSK